MSMTEGAVATPPDDHQNGRRRKRKYGPISITDTPGAADLDSQPHTHEEADHFSLFTPQQVEDETRTVRLDMAFTDALKIRDQAEMIIACMQEIIRKTREHRIGSIRQRIEARREADSLRRVMARLNGKCPHGDRYIPKHRR